MKDLRTYVLEGFKLGKNKVKKEDDFVDLDLPSKTLWGRYNVGATCESKAESWYGDYFMWGDPESINSKTCDWKHYKYAITNYNELIKYCPNDKTDYCAGNRKPDNKSVLDMEDDMASTNIVGDWKMPTKEQCEELINNTTSKWVRNYNDIQGLNGRLFTSNTNGNILFMPAAGQRKYNNFENVGSYVRVWSSELFVDNPKYAFYLYSDNENIHTYAVYTSAAPRFFGFSVRAVMN